ncbi:MAG: SH3 domain-containing protein [Betaproteobacteria bacterium]
MTRSAGRRRCAQRSAGRAAVIALAIAANCAAAADFLSTADAATVLYDAPSAKARPLFVLSRDTPVEVIVPVEGWTKVRDVGGTIGWIEKKSLADRRSLVVRVPAAEVRANPEDAAPLVFRAEQGVLLELAEPASGSTTTSMPGWVKVRHRDGQTGFVRITQVFGL